MTTVEPDTRDAFAVARQVADAVLFEGYVLYPYRASSAKNQMRWQFGVLVPPSYADVSSERSAFETQVLLDPDDVCVVDVELRFLQVQSRVIEQALPNGTFAVVDELVVDDAVHVPWDEGVDRSVCVRVALPLPGSGPTHLPFTVPGGTDVDLLCEEDRTVGRFVRQRWDLSGDIIVETTAIDGPYSAVQLTVRVENTAQVPATDQRDRALRASLVVAHALVAADGGRFVSSTDSPEWAKPYVAALMNTGAWPVLVGAGDSDDVLLCTPIILEDHPQIAPESSVQLYDATEIDEILTLRTMALTDQEKREARGTDPRAAAVIDQVDSLPPEMMDRLHGAIRQLNVKPTVISGLEAEVPDQPPWWNPEADASVSPETDTVVIDGVSVSRGSRVVLRPGRHRRTDAQDLFLVGRTATVQAVVLDVDDETYLAVTVDDDPGAEMAITHGRFRYFRPDEVEAL
ncbi:MAG: hypothetical protein QOG53_1964 [Frankiales bacterium]|nr:hypothetical protein [Frankiales bacterium]